MSKVFKNSLLPLLVITLLSFSLKIKAASDNTPESKPKHKIQATEPNSTLGDGLYLVVRAAHEAKSLEPLGETEKLVKNDFHFLEPLEREPFIYLVLQTKPFVPLMLGTSPLEDQENGTGKPRLQLQLTEDQQKPLAEFTTANLGKTVAIVIDGEVVTTHKVKSVITGGKLQIVRCTRHGCETLFTSLLKDRAKN